MFVAAVIGFIVIYGVRKLYRRCGSSRNQQDSEFEKIRPADVSDSSNHLNVFSKITDSLNCFNFGGRRGPDNDSQLKLSFVTVDNGADYNVNDETIKTHSTLVSGSLQKFEELAIFLYFRYKVVEKLLRYDRLVEMLDC